MRYEKKEVDTMSTLPTNSGKTSIDKLAHVQKLNWDSKSSPAADIALYKFEHNGLTYDFLWRPRAGSDKLFVMFSGDALREKNNPPVFQRWSWASEYPGNCLYFSDPSLHLDDELGLAWYVGTEETDAMHEISNIISQFASNLNIDLGNVYSYGSSGGGFAAIRLLHFMPKVKAISINPQTNITKYESRNVEKFLNICFSGMDRESVLKEYPNRISLLNDVSKLKGRDIYLVQNSVDRHHYIKHYAPLCLALGENTDHNPEGDHVRKYIFDHPEGHRKGEPLEVFQFLMSQIRDGIF